MALLGEIRNFEGFLCMTTYDTTYDILIHFDHANWAVSDKNLWFQQAKKWKHHPLGCRWTSGTKCGDKLKPTIPYLVPGTFIFQLCLPMGSGWSPFGADISCQIDDDLPVHYEFSMSSLDLSRRQNRGKFLSVSGVDPRSQGWDAMGAGYTSFVTTKGRFR